MTYDTARRRLEESLAVEHALSEAWTRHAYEGTEFAKWLDAVPEAGAPAMPREVLDQAVVLTAGLPEAERSRLVTVVPRADGRQRRHDRSRGHRIRG